MKWGVIAFLIGLFTLIMNLPLGWVAPRFVPDMAGENLQYSGTVWQGSVRNVDLLGTANFQIKLSQIFSDKPVILDAGNGANTLSGNLGTKSLSDLNLTLDVADLPLPDQRLQGLIGKVIIRVNEARFTDRCQSANGMVSTDVLKVNSRQFGWEGPVLDGPISCDDGKVVFDLAGQEGRQIINAHIEIDPAGEYFADITVETSQPEASAVLPIFGFTQRGREFVLTEQGRWR